MTIRAERGLFGDVVCRADPGGEPNPLAGVADAAAQRIDTLHRAVADRDAALGCVSHELRSPMAVIRLVLDLFADGEAGALTADQSALVERATRAAGQIELLVGDLTEASAASRGKLAVAPKRICLDPVIDEVLARFGADAADSGVLLAADTQAGLPDVDADPRRVTQVLTNLVANALAHTGSDGAVVIKADWAGDAAAVRVSVKDTGAGIRPEELAGLFEPWAQGRDARGGLGLGLHISRQLVETGGGRLWAESVPGSGSVFCFTVPVWRRSGEDPGRPT